MTLEGRDQPQQPELSLQVVKEYLAQYEKWYGEGLDQFRSLYGKLPTSWEHLLNVTLIHRAYNENRKLLPIIHSELSVKPDLVALASFDVTVGQPVSGDDIDINCQMSESTLWLMDRSGNRTQTMMRLLIFENKNLGVVDVYSDPASIKNLSDTHSSRTLHLMQYTESHNADVFGWIPISEKKGYKIPEYPPHLDNPTN